MSDGPGATRCRCGWPAPRACEYCGEPYPDTADEASALRTWNAELRAQMRGHVREMDRLVGENGRLLALAVAASQFLRSPALFKLRVQGEWLTRDEVVERIITPKEKADAL